MEGRPLEGPPIRLVVEAGAKVVLCQCAYDVGRLESRSVNPRFSNIPRVLDGGMSEPPIFVGISAARAAYFMSCLLKISGPSVRSS